MKAKLLGVAMLACSISQASAVIIDVTYTGTASGLKSCPTFTNCTVTGQFSNQPFTAEFVFDTDKGILQITGPGTYRLDGGLVTAFLDLGDLGIWGGFGGYFDYYGNSFLMWNDDFSSVSANAGGQYHLLSIPTQENRENFQFGLCPTNVGGPCGSLGATSFSVSVPSPIVGAGLPNILLVSFGLLIYWFRRAVS